MTFKKETFGFRKAKKVTTIGGTRVGSKEMLKGAVVAGTIAVLPFVAGGHSVNADEVTTPSQPDSTAVATNPNPATNLTEVQPAPTPDQTSALSNAGTTTGTVTSTVTSPTVDKAVSTAEQAGVKVSTTETKTVENMDQANADFAKQTESINQATDAQKTATAQIDTAKKELEKTGATTTVGKTVTVSPAEAQAKTKEIVDNLKTITQKTLADKDAYKKAVQDAINQATLAGFTKDQLNDLLSSIDLSTSAIVNIQNTTNTSPTLDKSSDTRADLTQADIDALTGKVGFDDGTGKPTQSPQAFFDQLRNNKDLVLKVAKVGDSWTYNNALMYKGEPISIKYTLKAIRQIKGLEFLGDHVYMWGLPDKVEQTIMNSDKNTYDLTFINAKGQEITLDDVLIGNGDIDWQQYIQFGTTPTKAIYGSNVQDKGNNKYQALNKGTDTTSNPEGQLWTTFKNLSHLTYTFGWEEQDGTQSPTGMTTLDGKQVLSVNGAWHELGGMGFIIDLPTPPKIATKVAVDQIVVTAETHKVQVSNSPAISKTVENDSGVDVNGHMVPKGSTDPFVLHAPTLKAGRPVFKDGEVYSEDIVPQGYKVDREATEKANPNYVFDWEAHKVTPTKDYLAQLNVQTSKDFKLADIKLIGSPVNDNGTYENDYTFHAGEYTTVSGKVVIYTPGTDDPNDPNHGGSTIQPTKQVFDKEGNDIDGKTVKAGQEIVYVGKWDLDQYKNIMAGVVAISKGFGYIDNYDESKVDLNVEGTTIKNTKGEVVKGLTPYVIKNLSDAPQAIKDLVKNSGVSIEDNDEFVIWVADDYKAFYDKYVVTGDSIFFTMPAKVKDTVKTGESIDNIVYQIDFGNGYAGNMVHNTVKNPEPKTPQTPEQPKTPTSDTPVQSASLLPHTGEKSSSIVGTLGALFLAVATLFGLAKVNKKEEI